MTTRALLPLAWQPAAQVVAAQDRAIAVDLAAPDLPFAAPYEFRLEERRELGEPPPEEVVL